MKYFGNVGFAMSVERDPGIFENTIQERPYYGDVIKNTRRWENGDKVNDDFRVNNQISIIVDSFCIAHASRMKYITWLGHKWKIESVDISFPRMIVTMGGLWNGSEPEAGPDEAPEDAGGNSGEQARLFSAP